MNAVTRETRRASYLKRPNRKMEILEVLGDRELTARQICAELGADDMNYVRPRLTELLQQGKVEVIGKTWDYATERKVAVWKVVKEV